MLPRARALPILLVLILGCGDAGGLEPNVPVHKAKAAASGAPKARGAASAEHEAVIEDVPDPEAKRLFEEHLGTAAVPTGPAKARLTALALGETARGEAAGMKPLGEAVEATLGTGRRMVLPVTIPGGGCVTFIAQGGLGVIEVDLFLVPAGREGVHVLAQDAGTGPIAVIGGRGRCFQNPGDAALEAELHATVRRGSGVVLLRGYGAPRGG